MDLMFSLSHKIFWYHIKMFSEDNRCFVFGNRYPNPGNCHPILEAGYHMMKDEEGVAKKLARMPTG